MDLRSRHGLPLLSLLAALAAFTALTVGTRETAHGQAAPGARPNIVVVMTDDQTAAELAGMPATRRLVGSAGVTFNRAYVSYPVCCPSRATYLTGQYAHNHGVMGLYPPSGGYGAFDKANSLPVWLRRAGYRTAHIGKFLNGYGDQQPADVPPGWTDWHATVDYSTYRMWGYKINHDGRLRRHGRAFRRDPRQYQTDVLSRIAARTIADAGRRPLFLSVAFLAPHHEDRRVQRRSGQTVRPAPRHVRAFGSAPLRRTASFNESDMSDKPRFLRRHARRLGAAGVARIQAEARSRRAALLAVDDGVRRIVSALRARDMLDNTYIVFTSDNGYMQGQHRVRAGKMLPYEPSTRVPLVVRGPGLPRGATSRELVANVDLAPTLLDIAGARSGAVVDGRSLLPFARRPARRSQRAVLHETGGSRYVGLRGQDESANRGRALRRVLTYRAVRTRRWLYVRYRGGGRELYDMRRDPDQLRSLHRSGSHRRTRRALARELRRLAHCSGESCLRPSGRIPGPARARRAA